MKRTAALQCVAAILCSIAARTPPLAAQTIARATPDSAEVSVARAVGERLRREHGSFVVFPTFLGTDGNAPEGSIEDFARRSTLLDVVRKAAHTQYADTMAYMDDRRRPKLPDTERFFLTLATDPSIQGDTATADVLLENVPKTVGAVERNLFRYWFVRTNGRWGFLRRTLLYAT
jgi:hypothetical protein